MAGDLRAPFPWFGGKSRAAELVWERFGTVVNYVEPFFGSGAVPLSCPEAQRPRVETVNDWNCYLANFWRAVSRDAEGVARAADWPVNETDLHARHRYLLRKGPELRALLEDPHAFDTEAAGWWVWGASAWIGSGWCEEGRQPARQPPVLSGGDGAGARDVVGRGIHAAGMREPSRQLPELGGCFVEGVRGNRTGKGIHAAGARGPSRQLPDLGGTTTKGAATVNVGRGLHGREARTRLHDLFASLQERLRYTRVACGDWARICTPAVTYRHGLTAVFLDPPYEGFEGVYGASGYDPQRPKSGAKITAEERAMWAMLDTWQRAPIAAWEAAPEEERAAEPPLTLSMHVRAWAIAHGERKDMRICLAGYEGEHDMPPTWEVVAWKAKGGYGNQRAEGDNENAGRERLWFSPACLRPGVDTGQLDMFGGRP
jgi:site-specific DNA-adenine methylase